MMAAMQIFGALWRRVGGEDRRAADKTRWWSPACALAIRLLADPDPSAGGAGVFERSRLGSPGTDSPKGADVSDPLSRGYRMIRKTRLSCTEPAARSVNFLQSSAFDRPDLPCGVSAMNYLFSLKAVLDVFSGGPSVQLIHRRAADQLLRCSAAACPRWARMTIAALAREARPDVSCPVLLRAFVFCCWINIACDGETLSRSRQVRLLVPGRLHSVHRRHLATGRCGFLSGTRRRQQLRPAKGTRRLVPRRSGIEDTRPSRSHEGGAQCRASARATAPVRAASSSGADPSKPGGLRRARRPAWHRPAAGRVTRLTRPPPQFLTLPPRLASLRTCPPAC